MKKRTVFILFMILALIGSILLAGCSKPDNNGKQTSTEAQKQVEVKRYFNRCPNPDILSLLYRQKSVLSNKEILIPSECLYRTILVHYNIFVNTNFLPPGGTQLDSLGKTVVPKLLAIPFFR
jgi:ABC-type oligopeptide transport system substrate-binding subunit